MNRQAQAMLLLWAAVAGLGLFMIGYMELRRPDTIRTKTVNADRIIAGTVALKNNKDEIVALLSSSSDGSPQISLYDRQQKLRMSISLRANGGPSISLLDADSGARAVLSLNDRQEATLVFNDPSEANDQKGPQRMLLGLDTSGSGFLRLLGMNGALNLSSGNGRMSWNPVAGAAQDLSVQK